jgi:hypothetical protein
MIDMGIEASLDIFQKKKKERIVYLVHELLERGERLTSTSLRAQLQ